MSNQAHTQFLEKWLTLCSATTTTATANSAAKTTARAIVQAWTTLRDSLQSPSAEESQQLHQSLQTLNPKPSSSSLFCNPPPHVAPFPSSSHSFTFGFENPPTPIPQSLIPHSEFSLQMSPMMPYSLKVFSFWALSPHHIPFLRKPRLFVWT
ncbi:hypothetical protein V8G54_026352 [Vigna mungo]|uniref:Uncharacterized protein n=1 Tax=Vigna mungo TaxID=3915 RepID=A0AAQ3N0B0_VIGMU